MASGGKSSSSGGMSSNFGNILGAIAAQINREVDPVRKMFMSQMQGILKGDLTTGSAIPLIQSGVRAARDAGAVSAAQTQGYLSQTGAAQSPFAASLMALTSQGTEQQIAGVPSEVAQGYLGQISGAVQGIGGQALSGLASAAQTNYRTSQSGSNFAWQDPFSLWMQS